MKRALIICILLLFTFGWLWTEGFGLVGNRDYPELFLSN